MPIKILLADKSITIQKVVEMLFSGRDYEVACVSDGETALSEAARVMPDVVLADVDLPRLDGYSFAARLKQTPQLAKTPVILMMSRDDVYDSAKGKQSGIVDNIAKPFESQELIGKVKKALASLPPRIAEKAPAAPPIPAAPPRVAAPAPPPPPAKPKQQAPTNIFDIIQDAPTPSELKGAAALPAEDESIFYEVEPEVEEVEEPLVRESAAVLPVGPKAVQEMRAGLGLAEEQEEDQSEIVPFEAFDLAMETAPKVITHSAPKPASPAIAAPPPSLPLPPPQIQAPMASEQDMRKMVEDAVEKMAKQAFEKMPPPQAPTLSPSDIWSIAEETVAKMAKDVFAQMPQAQAPQVSDDALQSMVDKTVARSVNEAVGKIAVPGQSTLPEKELRSIAEETISRMAVEVFKDMTPPVPKISEDTIRRGIEEAVMKVAREIAADVIEKIAWEVIPQLAEHLIQEEIAKLKAMEP